MVVENIRRPGQLLNNAWNELAMIDRAKVIHGMQNELRQ